MCTRKNLQTALSGFNALMLLGSTVLLMLGFLILLNKDYEIAFGRQALGWGGGMLLSSVLLTATGAAGCYGGKAHNKFMLLIIAAVLSQASIVISMSIATRPAFDDGILQDCVKASSRAVSDECFNIFSDIRMIRFFRLWLTYFESAGDDETSKKRLQDVENSQFCCGFGPPRSCTGQAAPNASLDGAELLQSDMPIHESIIDRCSLAPTWYAESRFCAAAGSGEVGCPYLFPVSPACERPTNERRGCAQAWQEDVFGIARPIATTAIVFLICQLLHLLLGTCLFFKRKYHDILPPRADFVDRKYEKYRNQTIHDILPHQAKDSGAVDQDEEQLSVVDDEDVETGHAKGDKHRDSDGSSTATGEGHTPRRRRSSDSIHLEAEMREARLAAQRALAGQPLAEKNAKARENVSAISAAIDTKRATVDAATLA